jgi:predicted phage replisome organizer
MNLSFIKLDINILDDNKIKLIRKYPDGDKLLILWLGLLCMAMKSDTPGYIYITNDIPYTEDDLSKLLEIEVKTISMGLELFKRYNMIDIIKGGIIEIINFNKHQNLDKLELIREQNKIRQQNYRNKKKQLIDKTVTQTVTQRNATDKTRQDKTRQDKKKYRDCVSLTETEYNKLINDYGKDQVDTMLDKLNNYKGSKGKKYKSDYMAIHSWVIESIGAKKIVNEIEIYCPKCKTIVNKAETFCGKCGLDRTEFKSYKKE